MNSFRKWYSDPEINKWHSKKYFVTRRNEEKCNLENDEADGLQGHFVSYICNQKNLKCDESDGQGASVMTPSHHSMTKLFYDNEGVKQGSIERNNLNPKWNEEQSDLPTLTKLLSSGMSSMRIRQMYLSRRFSKDKAKNLSYFYTYDPLVASKLQLEMQIALLHKQALSQPNISLVGFGFYFCYIIMLISY